MPGRLRTTNPVLQPLPSSAIHKWMMLVTMGSRVRAANARTVVSEARLVGAPTCQRAEALFAHLQVECGEIGAAASVV